MIKDLKVLEELFIPLVLKVQRYIRTCGFSFYEFPFMVSRSILMLFYHNLFYNSIRIILLLGLLYRYLPQGRFQIFEGIQCPLAYS